MAHLLSRIGYESNSSGGMRLVYPAVAVELCTQLLWITSTDRYQVVEAGQKVVKRKLASLIKRITLPCGTLR